MNKEIEPNHIQVSLTENQPVRTQFQIFTVFGDYILGKREGIWTSSLLTLMDQVGVSERAVRATLSRMRRKGWIASRRDGRRSKYQLTDRGRALLELGQMRIFEDVFRDWDHQWHLVIYSLSEEKRKLRETLRTQLAWLGFGQLAPGTWISPHNRRTELDGIITELGAQPYVDMFSGVYLGPSEEQDLIERSWDLQSLEKLYKGFIAKYGPKHTELQGKTQTGGNGIAVEDCFVEKFWLTHDFQSFPLTDPNLPVDLLPGDWAGAAARRLFDEYHQLLGKYVDGYVDDILSEPVRNK